MISKSSVNYLRISSRKLRYVIDHIRGKSVPAAFAVLSGSAMRGAPIMEKLLKQAVDAASRNSHVPAERLFVSKVLADQGPTMRRFRAASMGRASLIHKRTSHITLELDALKPSTPALPKAAKKVASEKTVESAASPKKADAKRPFGKKLVGAK